VNGPILLTGASGLLGSVVHRELLDGSAMTGAGEVLAPGMDVFDLDRPDTVIDVVLRARPSLILHLAADARVDRCEEHPADAYRTNARGTAHLASAARRAGARIVMMSTDYVFDGEGAAPYREYATTRPINVYGRSKEEAERALLAIAPDRLVIRSSSLFGAGGPNFVRAILDRALRGEPLEVVDDQAQAPTWAGHLAPAIVRAALSDSQGILHVAAAGSCTWFQFARAILDSAGIDVPCAPIPSSRSKRPARRPRYSVLDCSLAAESLGIALPDWIVGLAGHLAGEKADKKEKANDMERGA
jgi:dTDP-4-dehydrorhamnose reductase